VLWTPLAEIAERFLKKGSQVYIEGKLTTRSYDDKDGIKKYITEVVGREMTLLGRAPDSTSQDSSTTSSSSITESKETVTTTSEPSIESSNTEIDDLPF